MKAKNYRDEIKLDDPRHQVHIAMITEILTSRPQGTTAKELCLRMGGWRTARMQRWLKSMYAVNQAEPFPVLGWSVRWYLPEHVAAAMRAQQADAKRAKKRRRDEDSRRKRAAEIAAARVNIEDVCRPVVKRLVNIQNAPRAQLVGPPSVWAFARLFA